MGFFSKLFKSVPKEEQEGLSLDFRAPRWKLSKTKNMPAFLRALINLVPEGSILYIEGGSPSEKIQQFLNSKAVPEQAHIIIGTIWPRPLVYHIPATAENLSELADIAEKCVTPEVAVHLHVYYQNKVLLSGFDAFWDPFYISMEIPEEKIKDFCGKLSIKYEIDTE